MAELRDFPALLPGDIGATKGGGLVGFICRNLFLPKTDRFHFFMIGDKLQGEDDYVILESIGKGIAIGRLSFYKGFDVELYRPILGELNLNPNKLRKRAAQALSKYGRAKYDWKVFAIVALEALGLIFRGKFPPWDGFLFSAAKDNVFVCTEAVARSWKDVGVELFPKEFPAFLPQSFRQAEEQGTLVKIFPN